MAGEKVLIVDDDAAVCKVISRVVSSKGLRPEAVHSGPDALARLEEEEFDLVVLDIKLNGMDGFEVLDAIRGSDKDVPIIILSGNSESYNKLLGLENGADDYMTKPFDPAFLAAKIQALIRRNRKNGAGSEVAIGELRYFPSSMKLLKNDEEVVLSTKEHSLLRLFMENPGKPFTKEELYRRAWNDGEIDENTVMVHISRLRGKVEANVKNPRYILTVWGTGYKFADA